MERYGELSHISQGTRISVSKEGEFLPRGRIEDVTYDDSSDEESDSDDSESNSSESESQYTSESDEEESDESSSHFDDLEI